MNPKDELYYKYMAFNQVMFEDYKPIEIAAVMAVQALSIYRTSLSEEDYLKMVDSIYENRFGVQKLQGPNLQ